MRGAGSWRSFSCTLRFPSPSRVMGLSRLTRRTTSRQVRWSRLRREVNTVIVVSATSALQVPFELTVLMRGPSLPR
jgi:hypothetical protein